MKDPRDKQKNYLKQQLREMSTSAGAGAYNTPYAFNDGKGAKNTVRNYYLKMGYKLVDNAKLRKKTKGLDYKDLWK